MSRQLKVALVARVGANVGVLPRPEHRQEVVGVAPHEQAFDELDRLLERGEPHLPVRLFAEEVLRERPSHA